MLARNASQRRVAHGARDFADQRVNARAKHITDTINY